MENQQANETRIAELESELKKEKGIQARKWHAPDKDPTVVYVMVEAKQGGEQFVRDTVNATLAGCHSNWTSRDTFMEVGERQVRVAKVRMTEICS